MMSRSRISRLPALVLSMTMVAMFLSMIMPGSASAAACVNSNDPLNPRIVNSGSLTISNCSISGNSTNDPGGGVYNDGDLTLTNVVISGNTVSSGDPVFPSSGGGIYNNGTLRLINVVVTGNNVVVTGNGSSAVGGGIHNDFFGTIYMTNVTVIGNTAGTGGGGIANSGTIIGTGVAVANNTTNTGDGGGILNDNSVSFCVSAVADPNTCGDNPSGGNSLVSGNQALAGNGGGIADEGGTVTLSDSTLDSNQAGAGGGVWTDSGSIGLVNVTISNNHATGNGGGIFNDSGSVCCPATNITIAKNTADGNGGGVYTTGGFTILGSATIADNAATGSGGGVYGDDALTEFENTLLARNGANCAGTIQSDGLNLDTDGTCQFGADDLAGVSNATVGLRSLDNYGGPIQGSTDFTIKDQNGNIIAAVSGLSAPMKTMALNPDSPAVDAWHNPCQTTSDERGLTSRPQDGKQTGVARCDIGAYELAPCLTVDKTCAVVPPTGSFTCKTPITALTMQWAPGSMTDASRWVLTDKKQVIDIKAWNGKVGDKGATIVSTQCGLNPGDTVTVDGLGKNPDVFWQIYNSDGSCVPDTPSSIKGTQLGQSKFHVGGASCDDTAMNGVEDCGKFEGDGKDNKSGFINDWKLEGMTSSSSTNNTLVCNAQPGQTQQNCVVPIGGGQVVYTYTVTNIGPTPVTGVMTDVIGNNTVDGFPVDFTLTHTGDSVKFTSTATITQTTTNTATASGDNSLGLCTASDSATVHVACVIGYPYTDPGGNPKTSIAFNESGVLRAFQPDFAGPDDTIRVFYNDEHALTLGVRQVVVKGGASPGTTNFGLATPPTTQPASAGCLPPSCADTTTNPPNTNPPKVGSTATTGDFAALDASGRPMFPALFITDLTLLNDPDSKAGDWQFGGTAIPPHFVSGTWKGAVKTVDKTRTPAVTTITPDADPTKNNFTLGPNSDPAPPGLVNEGYGTEVRWNVNDLRVNTRTGTPGFGTGSMDPTDTPLSQLKGHTFRMQFMVHDGDQNKTGGDVGQNCTIVSIPRAK